MTIKLQELNEHKLIEIKRYFKGKKVTCGLTYEVENQLRKSLNFTNAYRVFEITTDSPWEGKSFRYCGIEFIYSNGDAPHFECDGEILEII